MNVVDFESIRIYAYVGPQKRTPYGNHYPTIVILVVLDRLNEEIEEVYVINPETHLAGDINRKLRKIWIDIGKGTVAVIGNETRRHFLLGCGIEPVVNLFSLSRYNKIIKRSKPSARENAELIAKHILSIREQKRMNCKREIENMPQKMEDSFKQLLQHHEKLQINFKELQNCKKAYLHREELQEDHEKLQIQNYITLHYEELHKYDDDLQQFYEELKSKKQQGQVELRQYDEELEQVDHLKSETQESDESLKVNNELLQESGDSSQESEKIEYTV